MATALDVFEANSGPKSVRVVPRALPPHRPRASDPGDKVHDTASRRRRRRDV